jgi:hypothetical protein
VLKSETAQLLMWAQGVDNRTITEATVAVWHDAVGEYEFADAIQALRVHIRDVPRMANPTHGCIRTSPRRCCASSATCGSPSRV